MDEGAGANWLFIMTENQCYSVPTVSHQIQLREEIKENQ
jgi:hypothetical protein